MTDNKDDAVPALRLNAGLGTTTCAMPKNMQPVSIATLTRALQEIDLLPIPDQWILIDPHGRMHKGTVEQMTRLLVQEHPLMRTPFALTGA